MTDSHEPRTALDALLRTPCDCPTDYTYRGRHAPDCRYQFIHDYLDDAEIDAVLRYEAAAPSKDDTLRAALEAIFPALDWHGDHHFPHCSTIRYPGSRGPDPEPPDPCTCGGPEVFAALAATDPTPPSPARGEGPKETL